MMSTSTGTSFNTAFNAWYYSSSPCVADYEREQPWLQQAVRAAICLLLGILTVSEKAYSMVPDFPTHSRRPLLPWTKLLGPCTDPIQDDVAL